jgi:hypothetical protein
MYYFNKHFLKTNDFPIHFYLYALFVTLTTLGPDLLKLAGNALINV